MSNPDCEVCQGRGHVRLPLYRKMAITSEVPEPPGPSGREYPCPECGDDDRVPIRRAVALSTRRDIPGYLPDEAIDRVRFSTAHALVDFLVLEGLITFTVEHEAKEFKTRVGAKIAAVHPSGADQLEAQIAARQQDVAARVVERAIADIDNWGSMYARKDIEKYMAAGFIRGALRRELEGSR